MRAAGLALLGAFAAATPSAAQTAVPAGTELAVRLAGPVASHSARVGDPVDAVLIAPVESAGRPMVSAGARIRGRVTLVRKVVFGVRREKASLGVVFDAIDFGEGAWRRLDAAVARVDNARERVDRGGVIRGIIRATAGPATRATSRLRHLPSLGLYPDPALLAYKRRSFPGSPILR
ncbi:MAG: hypothetical protein IPM24_17275 [Bryobacterales bacterium]|nr:hypothetical protein [Bryobacterales bacterium]